MCVLIKYALLVIACILMVPVLAPDVLGHGGGSDQAEPITFAGMEVTVRTTVTPSDITVGDVDDVNVNLRFFDTLTDVTLENVTYRVEVWQNDELLARNLFYDPDGILDVEVRPKASCNNIELWRCVVYGGSEHISAPGALFVQGNGKPTITGPVFVKGGLYNIKVDIEGASTTKTLVGEVLSYDTFISIAQEQDFSIKTANDQNIPVIVKTYYDDVKNFQYDVSNNSIAFDMPFSWEPRHINLIQVVHEEVRIPKSFAPYAQVEQFKGYVNGIEVNQRMILNDRYSIGDTNNVHFTITNNELKRLKDLMSPEDLANSDIEFKLVPQSDVSKESTYFYLVNAQNERVPTNVTISWDSRHVGDEQIPFEITFLDDNGSLIRDIHYTLFLVDSNGQEIERFEGDDPTSPGIYALEGIDVQKIHMPSEGQYRIDVLVHGTGLDIDPTYSGIGSGVVTLESGIMTDTESKGNIPSWVKSNAGWWADGSIDDESFIQGIQYLIREGIINIPATTAGSATTNEIPSWVKSNAGWWADGSIDDESFIQGIQYLIREGIMRIDS